MRFRTLLKCYRHVIIVLLGVVSFKAGYGQCDFTFGSNVNGCAPLVVLASAVPPGSGIPYTNYTWVLNGPVGFITDSTSGTNNSFSRGLSIPGNYCLTLRTRNASGDTCSITKCTITVAAKPTVNITFSQTTGCSPLSTFVQCNTTAGCGTIDSFVIDWGCGQIYNSTGCPSGGINQVYNCPPGNCYSPTVIVKNSCGCYKDSTYNGLICIINKPIANFTADTMTANCATAPLTSHFTATDAGPGMTYNWYVDNSLLQSNSSTLFTHTFPVRPQCYDVKLVVQHFSGAVCVDSTTKQVCVRAQPVINYFSNITTTCVNASHPATLVLTVDTTIGLNSLAWQLSGPQSFTNTTGKTATYSINTPGTYTATGTGNFGPGCSNSLTQQVLVANLRPTAAFTISDTFSCSVPFDPVITANACTGCNYAWSIGGAPVGPTGQVITPHFTTYTCARIVLYVSDGNSCKDTFSLSNAICTRKINPRIALSRSKGCSPVCVNFTNATPLTGFPDPIASTCWSFPGSGFAGACQSTISQCFTNVGCNSVKLIMTTTTGCVDSVTLVDTVCVGSPPVCTTLASPSTMCFGDTIHFTATCDSFDFIKCIYGDGLTDVLQSSSWQHSYQDTGFFTALIIPYNDSCSGDTTRISFTIYPPIALFHDSSGCLTGDTIFLVNQSKGATNYLWQFCDGTTSILAEPVIVLPPCDTCTITLTATNSIYSCSNKASKFINTSCDSVSFTPRDTSGCGNFYRFSFINTSINHDQAVNSTRWDWDWNIPPNNFPIGNGLVGDSLSHNFATGRYTIAMRTQSLSGCIDTLFGTVKVCKPIAKFGPTSVCLPLPICFQNLSTDAGCDIVTWSWSFGDGDTSSLPNPCHTYAIPGLYNVKLVITNEAGCSDSITKQVTAATPVNLDYHVDSILCPSTQECVTNNSTGINLTFEWKIPNALPTDTFVNPTPCFRFASPGDYPVYLKISSGNQCQVFDTVLIHNQYPVASGFASLDTLLCPQPPTAITFISTSQYVDSLQFWSFGDSSVAYGDTVFNYYTKAGIYYVKLIVLDKQGCSDTTMIDTIVVKGPYGDFGLTPLGMCSCKDTVHFTINTVEASTLTLIYGCNLGFSQQSISPIGSANTPSQLTFDWSYCIADSCQPQLLFGDTAGCQVLYDQFFIPIDSPEVKFAFDNYGVCINGTVCFFDSTTYHLAPYHSYTVKRIWDFGDGTIDSTSNNPNPCHYYGQIGGYAAKLYVYSNLGCFDSSVTTVVVVPSYPEAGFYADDSLVCANSPICFHDTSSIYYLTGADYWVWDFGDSLGVRDTSYTPDFCHIFRTGGYYRIHMCVYDSVGCADCDSSVVIRVIDNPIANAGGDRNICYGVVTQLNGSGGTTPLWDPAGLVSDPNIYDPTIQIYNDTTITLMVGDQYGCRDTDTAILSISHVFAEFNVGPLFCQGDSVCVTDASTNINGTLSMWIYDFATGDSINAGADICYNYPVFGTYGIQLTAIDDNGCWDTISHPVDILPSPNAMFSLNDTVICSDQQLCVTDLSTSNSAAPITSWTWNYGAGGNSLSGQTQPCYIYSPPYQANYPVSLVAKDQNGCVDTSMLIVTLNEIPRANFSWSVACETDLMPLVSLSAPGDGAIVGCEWLLWVGAPSPTVNNNCNTSFQFPAGSYPVQLVVTDINGCTDTIVKTVKSDSLSQLEIYPGDTTICLGDAVMYTVSGVFDQIVWQPSVWVDNPYSPVVTIQPEGNISYIVSATNGVCTSANDTFSIRTLQPIPITVEAVPQQVVLGLSSSISSQIPGRIDSVIWSPDLTLDCRECPNPIALPTQTTTYTATIYYSENGTTCTNSDSVTIEVLKVCDNSVIYIPNTFTPNGDGLNDVFMIRGLAATKINNFRVFDRWGKLVFEATKGEPNEPRWGWDGNDASGKKLNAAVYVYTYEIECINGDIVTGKGNITLIR